MNMYHQKSSISKIFSFVLITAFVLLGGVLLYATITNSTDLRSKAAQEQLVMKAWEFTGENNYDGWVLSGFTESKNENNALVMKTGKANTGYLQVSNVNTTLATGKKLVTFTTTVANPSNGQYKMAVKYLKKGSTEWSTINTPVYTIENGTNSQQISVAIGVIGSLTIDKLRISFVTMPASSTVTIDSVKLISTRPAGLVHKKGKLERSAGDRTSLVVSDKEKYGLRAAEGQTIDFDTWNNKTVWVDGELKNEAAVVNGKTTTTRYIVVASASAIQLAEEEIVVKEWTFTSDTENWSTSNTSTSGIVDGTYQATVAVANKITFNNSSTGLSLSKGTKRMTVAFGATYPSTDATYVANVQYKAKGSTEWKLLKRLEGKADGSIQTTTFGLSSNAMTIAQLRIHMTNAPVAAVAKLDALSIVMVRPVGFVYKRGTLKNTEGGYRLVVGSNETYMVVAKGGVSVDWATLVNQKIFVSGTQTLSADGKTKTITVDDASDIGLALTDEVVKEWTFDQETEGWYSSNVTSSGIVDKSYHITTATNSQIGNLDTQLGLPKGEKSLVVNMAVKHPQGSAYSFEVQFMQDSSESSQPSWKKISVLKGTGDDQFADVEIPITAGELMIHRIRILFSGVPSGTLVRINSIKLVAQVPAGMIVKTGKLTKSGDAYLLAVTNPSSRYYLISGAPSISFDSSVGQIVRVTGVWEGGISAIRTIKVNELLYVGSGLPIATPTKVRQPGPDDEKNEPNCPIYKDEGVCKETGCTWINGECTK